MTERSAPFARAPFFTAQFFKELFPKEQSFLRVLTLLLMVSLLGLISSCSVTPKKTMSPQPQLLALPEPGSLEGSFLATQRVTGVYRGEQYTMQVNLEKTANRVVLVGLGQMGVVLFTVDFDGTNLETTQSDLLPSRVNPAYILQDMMWSFWPMKSLEHSFAGRSLTIDEDGGERHILKGEELLLVVTYGDDLWSDPVDLQNPVAGYRLTVETLMWEQLQ